MLKENSASVMNNNDIPTSVMLQELLEDEEFLDDSMMQLNEYTQRYEDCVSTLIQGNAMLALEKMIQYSFLKRELLFRNNAKVLDLFLTACDNIPSFGEVDKKERQLISNVINEELLEALEVNDGITHRSKCLRTSAKLLMVDGTAHQASITKLMDKAKNALNQINNKTIVLDGSADKLEVCKLVELYFIQIQIKLQGKKLSPVQYELFCTTHPEILNQLQNCSTNGLIYHQIILKQLTTDHEIKPKKVRQHSTHPTQHNITDPKEKQTTARNLKEVSKPNKQKDIQTQLLITWKRISMYYERLEISNRTLLISLVVLVFITLRKQKFASQLKRTLVIVHKKVTPSLVQLLKILSSV